MRSHGIVLLVVWLTACSKTPGPITRPQVSEPADDHGELWTQVFPETFPTCQAFLSSADSEFAVAAWGVSTRSRSERSTWESPVLSTTQITATAMSSVGVLLANDGGLLTLDRRRFVQVAKLPMPEAVIQELENPEPDVILARSGAVVWLSTDRGRTWRLLPIGSDSLFAMHALDAKTFLFGTNRGLVETTDQGRSWRRTSVPGPPPNPWTPAIPPTPS